MGQKQIRASTQRTLPKWTILCSRKTIEVIQLDSFPSKKRVYGLESNPERATRAMLEPYLEDVAKGFIEPA